MIKRFILPLFLACAVSACTSAPTPSPTITPVPLDILLYTEGNVTKSCLGSMEKWEVPEYAVYEHKESRSQQTVEKNRIPLNWQCAYLTFGTWGYGALTDANDTLYTNVFNPIMTRPFIWSVFYDNIEGRTIYPLILDPQASDKNCVLLDHCNPALTSAYNEAVDHMAAQMDEKIAEHMATHQQSLGIFALNENIDNYKRNFVVVPKIAVQITSEDGTNYTLYHDGPDISNLPPAQEIRIGHGYVPGGNYLALQQSGAVRLDFFNPAYMDASGVNIQGEAIGITLDPSSVTDMNPLSSSDIPIFSYNISAGIPPDANLEKVIEHKLNNSMSQAASATALNYWNSSGVAPDVILLTYNESEPIELTRLATDERTKCERIDIRFWFDKTVCGPVTEYSEEVVGSAGTGKLTIQLFAKP